MFQIRFVNFLYLRHIWALHTINLSIVKFGYRFLYYTFQFALWAFFRRIYLHNAKGIPKDKPVLLACNHPNSFMDGCLFGESQPQPIHFIARGDAMNTPFKKWLFGQFHAVPIFRLQEGIENLHRNKQTFRECQELFEKNGKIIIFSEGICVQEKRVRKLKKGTGRMYFEIESNFDFNLGIQVIPVGFNYTFFNKPGAEVMINIGEPMPMERYIELYKENKAQGINTFTADLQEKIEERVIAIHKKEDEPLAENLLTLARNNFQEHPFPWKPTRNDRFVLEKSTCDTLNHISKNERDTYQQLSQEVEQYFAQLKDLHISDMDVAKERRYNWGKGLLFLLGWPLYILGYLFNLPPVWAGNAITVKIITNPVFYLSVRIVITYFLYLLVYIPLLLVLVAWLGNTWYFGLTAIAIMAISGYYALYYSRLWKDSILRWRYLNLKRKNHDLIASLKKQRQHILRILKEYKRKNDIKPQSSKQ